MNVAGTKLPFETNLILLILVLCAFAASAQVEDRRSSASRESDDFLSKHPDAIQSFERHMANREVFKRKKETPTHVPGGVGYGYYFDDNALFWTNSSISDYYIIMPDQAGGNLQTDQFLTSSCRSPMGTESLIWYYAQNTAMFWVFDWARPSTNRYQAGMVIPGTHPEYLSMRPDEFANLRQMCHIRNGTFYHGFSGGLYQWMNKVWLFNFSRGDWDYVYSYAYATTNQADALFTPGSGGYWGPIVETFQSTYTNLNPMGFDLVRLFQDGDSNQNWLSPNNSYVLNGYPFQLLSEAPNTSFVIEGPGLSAATFPIGPFTYDAPTHDAALTLNTVFGRKYRFLAPTTCLELGHSSHRTF